MAPGATSARSIGGFRTGGEGGIRTHEGLPPTRFPGERPRPLGDLSMWQTLDCRGHRVPGAKPASGIIMGRMREKEKQYACSL